MSTESRYAADALVNLSVEIAAKPSLSWARVFKEISRQAARALDDLRTDETSSKLVLGQKIIPQSSGPKSTLSVVKVTTSSSQAHLDIAAVGNSPVLRLRRGSNPVELVDLGENPDGTTSALPRSRADWVTGHATLELGDILILCTDGFERTYVDYEDELLSLLNRDESPAEKLPTLVNLMMRYTQGVADDRTVVALRFSG